MSINFYLILKRVDAKQLECYKLSEHQVSMGFTLIVQGKDLYN